MKIMVLNDLLLFLLLGQSIVGCLLSCKKINCNTILDLIFGLICILLIKTADIFAVLYFAASQVEYAENYDTKAQSAQFT